MNFVENKQRYRYLSLAISALLAFIMVFLQPFDTPKHLSNILIVKLLGYGGVVFLSMLFSYEIEHKWYINSGKKWDVQNELTSMFLLFVFISLFSNIYHSVVFGAEDKTIIEFAIFIVKFVLPLSVLIFPLILISRFQLGTTESQSSILDSMSKTDTARKKIRIIGDNNGESITFDVDEFCMATAQQNYVAFHLQNNLGELKEVLIRCRFADVEKQICEAIKVHRSFIVNPKFVEKVIGPKKKTQLILKNMNQAIPVSVNHVSELKEKMHIHP